MYKKISIILLGMVGFVFLVYSFNNVAKKFSISYFDENLWVSGSYYYQFFISGDYSRRVWGDAYAADQPGVTRLVFGAWLYPEYLKVVKQSPDLDYAKFLLKNGFYFGNNLAEYDEYKELLGPQVAVFPDDPGFRDELLQKYGPEINGNIDLIVHTRKVNSIILAITVISVIFYLLGTKGLVFSLFFAVLYASNPLVLESTLRAHSESLFVLFFNLVLIFILKFATNYNDSKNLVLLSIFMGLCASTKLNGIMLYAPYMLILVFFGSDYLAKYKPVKQLTYILTPLIISFLIFWILNPYAYPSPVVNIIRMYTQHGALLTWQIATFTNDYLPGVMDRLIYIYDLMLNSSPQFVLGLFPRTILNYSILFLFIIGVSVELKNIRNGKKLSKYFMVIFASVFLITLVYLQLAWSRYVVHLVFFYVYYVSVGLTSIFLVLKNHLLSRNLGGRIIHLPK